MANSSLRKIEVVPYDPEWPSIFIQEAKKIKLALGDKCLAIHHVGSTAVPNLAAKPKIDIIAEVEDLTFEYKGLKKLNYEYMGGYSLPLRKSFIYRSDKLNVNLHVFENNDPEIELNLLFRDYLCLHPKDRDKYAALKFQLLENEECHTKGDNMYKGYTLKKHAFIQDILRKKCFNRLRFVMCAHYTEWDAAKNFRNRYFFDPLNIKDPYTWTFKNKHHKHFIFYRGIDIVGYSHIQLWPEQRAAVRIIVIDEQNRGKEYGGKFLLLIEKWLKLNNYRSIHTESSPSALGFYKNLNYEVMPFDDPDGYTGDPDDIAMGKIL
ncbi:MAG: GNAT family N-acetyltransferase [Legionellales bacterium]|nr:GNAT family N-acetyltransferase [Legionellales bacterium]